ncbi:DNA polymerase III subunit gamma and tau [Agromyces aerolatus]|uniref:DNA polymerase III subunit gamma and tau n=1 Tax=Agromyces sp. LY-1074 TaxID=3074080 RepID=UPI002867A7CE|nr:MULTISPECIES: DNA polymerase III subunit gamma and tau [unclassified Agromyces]MDR5701452.1 DNA polymerase III subunit gamma and tau [Agromyces sp. LY-1074]MDR5704481.1 DNA polymerase III subunit gamma and tau [Agromyces sp. LY-1358]
MVTALYRRYRPENFAEMIGQSQVTEPLMTALRTDRVNHAYLFSGPRGCGKTTSARILARCLNCAEGPTDTPCGTCPSCVELSRGGGGSLDVVEIDAASHNGVDDARDLRERAVFAPARDRYKIFILDEAHMVTPQGFNALLKLVEEPPEHVKFIFATTEPDKVLGTIRSRTHHYPFRLVPPAPMLEYVQQLCEEEHIEVQPGVLALVVRAGGGSPRDTLSLLDQLIAGSEGSTIDYERAVALLGYTHGALLDEVVDAIGAGDAAGAFASADRVVQTGQDPRRFVEDLLERLRDLIVVAASSPEAAAAVLRGVPEDELARMAAQAQAFGQAELSRVADLVNQTLTEMTGATSPRLHLELMLARVLVPSADATERGALARVERLERRVGVDGALPGAGGAGTRAEQGAGAGASGAGGAGARTEPGAGGAGGAGAGGARAGGGGAGAGGARAGGVTYGGGDAGAGGAVRGRAGVASAGSVGGASAGAGDAGAGDAGADAGGAGAGAGGAGMAAGVDSEARSAAGATAGSAARDAAASWAAETASREASAGAGAGGDRASDGRPGAATGASAAGAAGSEAAAAPKPVGPVTLQQVRDAWPEVLAALQRTKRSAWMVAFTAQVRDYREDDILVLGFPSEQDVAGFRGGAPGQSVSELLRNSIAEVLGVRVKFIARAEGPGNRGGGDGGGNSGGPVDRAPGGPSDGAPGESARPAEPGQPGEPALSGRSTPSDAAPTTAATQASAAGAVQVSADGAGGAGAVQVSADGTGGAGAAQVSAGGASGAGAVQGSAGRDGGAGAAASSGGGAGGSGRPGSAQRSTGQDSQGSASVGAPAASPAGPVDSWATVAIPTDPAASGDPEASVSATRTATATAPRPQTATTPQDDAAPAGEGTRPTGHDDYVPNDADAPPEDFEPPFDPGPEPDAGFRPGRNGEPAASPGGAAPSAANSALAGAPAVGSSAPAGSATTASTRAPEATTRAPRPLPQRKGDGIQRYGEAVVREVLGATFLEEIEAPGFGERG